MLTVQLPRSVIDVAGPEAEHFLQNIVTTDLGQLGEGEAKPGALLTPQGKILFDFLVSRAAENRLRLDVRSDAADDFVRRLMLYRLRAKVEISKQEQLLVGARWENDSASSEIDSTPHTALRDTRFPAEANVTRVYAPAISADASIADWDALRIRNAVAESGSDYELGDAFPHDVLLDQNGGVGFKKGCYVGQEVVSRMQHRGTARRRVLEAEAATDLPPAGTQIMASGKAVGQLATVQGRRGLAIARIDRVKDALDAGIPLLAEEMPLSLSIPAWARFRFPEAAAGAEEA
jgi:folate-binding protein YgfZ